MELVAASLHPLELLHPQRAWMKSVFPASNEPSASSQWNSSKSCCFCRRSRCWMGVAQKKHHSQPKALSSELKDAADAWKIGKWIVFRFTLHQKSQLRISPLWNRNPSDVRIFPYKSAAGTNPDVSRLIVEVILFSISSCLFLLTCTSPGPQLPQNPGYLARRWRQLVALDMVQMLLPHTEETWPATNKSSALGSPVSRSWM